jgi:hypothetical protein
VDQKDSQNYSNNFLNKEEVKQTKEKGDSMTKKVILFP